MAIKIDLLPGYVRLQRIFKRLLAICIGIVVATGALLFVINMRQQEKLRVLTEDLEKATVIATEAKSVQAQADALNTTMAPTRSVVTFFVDAEKTGAQRAALLDWIRRYVFRRARVDSLDISNGQDVEMLVQIRSNEEYVQFLEEVRLASADGLFQPGTVRASGVPTFNNISPQDAAAVVEAAVGIVASAATADRSATGAATTPLVSADGLQQPIYPISVKLTAKLVTPVTVPVAPGETAAAAGAAAAGGDPRASGGDPRRP